jgi:hypothetical protein
MTDIVMLSLLDVKMLHAPGDEPMGIPLYKRSEFG